MEPATRKNLATRKRNVLNAAIARQVFLIKSLSGGSCIMSSLHVSQMYGVSPKTIRDIWNRWITSISSLE